MIRRGREKRTPFGARPEDPVVFSSKSTHLDFNPSFLQQSQLGVRFQNSPFQLADAGQLSRFGLTRVGFTPGFFVNFWVNWNNTGAQQNIIGKADLLVTGLIDYDLFITAGGLITFTTYTTALVAQSAVATIPLVAGANTMVTINCSYTNPNRFGVEIYLNNVLRGSFNFAGARRVDNAPMWIGSNASATGAFLNSMIDSLFIRKNYSITSAIRTTLYNSGLGCSYEQLVASSGFPNDKLNLGYWKNVDSSLTFWPDLLGEGTSFASPALSFPTIQQSVPTENWYEFPKNDVPNNGYFTSSTEPFSENDDISNLPATGVFAGGQLKQTTMSKVPITYYAPISGQTRSKSSARPVCFFNGTDVHYPSTSVAVDVLKNRSRANVFIVCASRALADQDVMTITTGTGSERFTYSLTSLGKHQVYLRQNDAEATPQQYQFAEDYVAGDLFVVRAQLDYIDGLISLELNGKPSGSFSLLSSAATSNTDSTLIKIGSGLTTGSQQLTIARATCFIDELAQSEVQNYYRYIKAIYDVPCY